MLLMALEFILESAKFLVRLNFHKNRVGEEAEKELYNITHQTRNLIKEIHDEITNDDSDVPF